MTTAVSSALSSSSRQYNGCSESLQQDQRCSLNRASRIAHPMARERRSIPVIAHARATNRATDQRSAHTSDRTQHSTVPASKSPKLFEVSIDYGTARSGFAYRQLQDGLTPMVCEMYDRLPPSLPIYPKTLTALLYHKQGDQWKAVEWGWPAKAQWIERMQAAERAGMVASFNAEWWLSTGFKLGLHTVTNTNSYGTNTNGASAAACVPATAAHGTAGGATSVDPLHQPLPPGITPEAAAGHFLSFLRQKILTELSKAAYVHPVTVADVAWSLAVPSAWSDASKASMRRAALAAGILSGTAASQELTVLHEAESALLYARDDEHADMHLGECILVVDAGGGTTDMTLMKVESREGAATFAEVTHREGVLFGGTHIDGAFNALVLTRLGSSVPGQGPYEQWSMQRRDEYEELIASWEAAKVGYDGYDPRDVEDLGLEEVLQQTAVVVAVPESLLAVQMPDEYAATLGLPAGTSAQDALAALQQDDGSCLKLSHADMQHLFSVASKPAVQAIQEMVGRAATPVDKLVLAGGLGSSPFFAQLLRKDCGSLWSELLVPTAPAKAVMLGGLVGLQDPAAITARRVNVTYGTRHALRYQSGDPDRVLIGGTQYTTKRFKPYVKKGDLIKVDQVVEHRFVPISSYQTSMSVDIWSSDRTGAKYVTEPGMHKLVDTKLPLDSKKVVDPDQYPTKYEMHFGRAEVTMRAKDLTTGKEVFIVAGLDADDQVNANLLLS